MKKCLKYLDKIEEYFMVLLFLEMSIVCFAQVVCRYILHASLVWSEELLRASFVWASCLGISYSFKTYAHLGVDFFVNLLPAKGKKIITLVGYAVCFAFLVLLAKIGYDFTIYQISSGRMNVGLQISQAWITAAVPVSCVLGCIRIIQVVLKDYVFSSKKASTVEEDLK